MTRPIRSLKEKILIPLLCVLVVTLTLIGIGRAVSFRRDFTRRLQEQGGQMAGLIHNVARGVSDTEQLQRIVGSISVERKVKLFVIIDGNPSMIVASTQFETLGKSLEELENLEDREELREALASKAPGFRFEKGDREFDYFRPLALSHFGPTRHDTRQGAVLVSMDTCDLHHQMVEASVMAVGVHAGMGLLLAGICWFLFHRHVLSPVRQIGTAMGLFHLSEDVRLIEQVGLAGELATLAGAWNGLVHRLHCEHTERTVAEAELRRTRDDLEERVVERTAELRRSNETLQMQACVIESMTEAVTVSSEDGRIVAANPAAESMFGYERHELLGQHLSVLRDTSDAAGHGVVTELKAAMAVGATWLGEIPRRRKDGSRFLAQAQFKAFDMGGRRHYFAIQEDITASKQAAATVRRQHAEMRALFDLIPAMIWFKDTNNGILRANQRAADAAGRSVEEMEGKSMRVIYPREAAQYYADDLEVIRSRAPKLGIVEELRDSEGQAIWIRTDKVPYCDEHGEVIGIVVVAEDITEIRQAEQLQAQFSAIMNATSDFVAIADPAGRLLYLNPAGRKMMGFDEKDDITGTCIADFHGEKELERTMTESIPVALRDGVWSGETAFRSRGGMEIPLWHVIVAHKTGDGVVEFIAATGRDLTERRRAAAELEEMHRQLLVTSRAAGMAEVATSVLHNVGNVLNSVNVSASMVIERVKKKARSSGLARVVALLEEHAANLPAFFGADAQGQKLPAFLRQFAEQLARDQQTTLEELQSLRDNIEHIKGIVAMQQSYARVAGVTEVLPMEDLVEDSIRMNAGALAGQQVEIQREYEPAPAICIEKHKALQILVNLICNAKQACHLKGGEGKRITLRVAHVAGMVRVSVSDNGVGIPPENLARIFNHGFTTKKDGHGFGLHSGALAAKEMGGSLRAVSDGPGLGATFILELPVTRDERTDHSGPASHSSISSV